MGVPTPQCTHRGQRTSSPSITWVNPWVSKPPDTQPNSLQRGGRHTLQPRAPAVVTPRGWEAAASGRPFLNYSFVLLRAHTAHSQARPTLQPGILHSAGFCWALCPAWRLWPCHCILFTTAIALTVHMSLEGSSRQVIAAAVSDLRETFVNLHGPGQESSAKSLVQGHVTEKQAEQSNSFPQGSEATDVPRLGETHVTSERRGSNVLHNSPGTELGRRCLSWSL